MNTREEDNAQFRWLLERRRDARQGIRWLRIMVYGACAVAVALIWAGRAEAAMLVWGCTPPTQTTDGKAITQPLRYRAYWGTMPSTVLHNIEPFTCSNPTSIQVPGPAGVTHYLTTTAAIGDGTESEYRSLGLRLASVDANPTKVDCVVSAYGTWTPSAWTPSTCVEAGIQTRQEARSRTITMNPSGGGSVCPALTESRMVTQPCVIASLLTVGGDVFIASPNPDYTTFIPRPWKLGAKAGTIGPRIKCDANRRIGEDHFRVTGPIVWTNGRKDYVVAKCERRA